MTQPEQIAPLNQEQITRGKNRLRAQVKELEQEIVKLKTHPLLRESQRLQRENARLQKRVDEVENAASNVLESALILARLINASFVQEPDEK